MWYGRTEVRQLIHDTLSTPKYQEKLCSIVNSVADHSDADRADDTSAREAQEPYMMKIAAEEPVLRKGT